jgi:hypothetical protein
MKLLLTVHRLLYCSSRRQTGSLFYLLEPQIEVYIPQKVLTYYHDLNCNDLIQAKK